MNILFVHGWGTDSRIWHPIAKHLPEHQIYFVDFGFLHNRIVVNDDNFGIATQKKNAHPNWHWINFKFGSTGFPPVPEPYLAIGHSMGVAWLLKNSSNAFLGLVSISGFARFADSDNLAALKKMKKGLENNPILQLKAFWRSANLQFYKMEIEKLESELSPQEFFDENRLLEGLDYLSHCNELSRLNELNCGVRALAGEDDKIVGKIITNKQWSAEQLRWTPAGGHGLPLSKASWCIDEINAFIGELDTTDRG